ncbi:MAG: HlyD family type I secretion periplasmic adaptor subunit [Rhodospirillales bacterium]|nr:HlyD family type I secretion periplasmic adaptor subunit [Alphaproteobacteria bacterium]MBL6948519.1 HlyD family type I secretion periplasmic adaptor subunit [Rhodospirillales bacterium]
MSAITETTGNERLDDLLQSHPMPSWRVFAWPVMIMLSLLVTWAFFAELDEVAVSIGEVVPQGKVRVIQHLEGGIVERLFVTEGDTVKAGDTLIQLDQSSTGTNKEELSVRLDSQHLVRSRLLAEAEGKKLVFPPEIAAKRPTLAASQRQAFDARARELVSTLNVLKEQVKQRELEVQELTARQKAVNRNYKLARERLKMSASLLTEGLTAKMTHLELEAEVESLDGEMQSLKPSIPKVRAAVEEAKQRLREAQIRFRREAREELGKTEQEIARIREVLIRATEQGFRAEIKSPVSGVVKNLRFNTIGGVIKPGEPILEIVPTGENLVVQSRLNPTDRGYVSEGQKATVKISTYDFARYGGLEGTVIQVAPDTSMDENGQPYFRVVVQTSKNYLGREEGSLPIVPGMQATVDIHTGKKSVMDYLIKPVLKLRHEAFRER